MAPAMSTLTGVKVPPGYGPAHLEMLLYRYLETLEIHHALRVIGRWPRHLPMGYYAAKILTDLPSNYFQQPRLLPTGPRFVYSRGQLSLAIMEQAVPMQQLHPASTTGCVGYEISENVLDAPLAQRRLRPLNSFMIFRSFCAQLFPGIPQKIKSMAISQMWQDDPLKAQWTILAKAYTIIRDHFAVPNPSLPTFVEMCVPLIGLTNPDQYLLMCGWKVSREESNLNLVKTDVCTYLRDFQPNPLDVKQVVEHCKERRYAFARSEEWVKWVMEDGTVFATERSYQGCYREPQQFVRKNMPQWPVEEFEVDEMYSLVDGDLPLVCDPETLRLEYNFLGTGLQTGTEQV